jgi:hypothetical protein
MRALLWIAPYLDFTSFKVIKNQEGVIIRKLTGIEDKEGKTRVIAIGDYWSQTALKPLHS